MTINSDRTSSTTTATNVASMFLDRVQTSADKEAFRYLVAGEWVSATWQQTAGRVETLAAGLLALGIEPEQRVGYRIEHAVRVDSGRSGDHVFRSRDHHRVSKHQCRRHRVHSGLTRNAESCSPRTPGSW